MSVGEADAVGLGNRTREKSAPFTPHPSPLPQGEREQCEEEDDDLPAVGKVWDSTGPSLSELMKQRNAAPTHVEATQPARRLQATSSPSIRKISRKSGEKLLTPSKPGGQRLHSLVCHGKLTTIEDGRAVIRYDRKHETFVKMLERNGKKDAVRDVLTQVTGESLGVKFEVDFSEPETSVAVMEAPPTNAPAHPAVQREVRANSSAGSAPSAGSMPPPTPAIRITDELVESLRTNEPLIKSLMDDLAQTIVKVEPPDPPCPQA